MATEETKKRVAEFQDGVGAFLKPYDFKGPRGHYWLDMPTGVLCMGFLFDKYGIDRFTVHLGFGVKRLYSFYDYPQQAKSPRVTNCHFVERVGWFNEKIGSTPITRTLANGKVAVDTDPWWKIRGYTTDEQFEERLEQVRHLVEDLALPIALEWRDIEKFKQHLTAHYMRDDYCRWIVGALSGRPLAGPVPGRSFPAVSN